MAEQHKVFQTRTEVIEFLQAHPGDDSQALSHLYDHFPSRTFDYPSTVPLSAAENERWLNACIQARDETCTCAHDAKRFDAVMAREMGASWADPE